MADEVPRDRRSALVRRDAKACPVSLVCYLCCAEFGTSSLKIHEKSCRKKHAWGLQNVLDDETVSSAQAKKNRAKCAEPSPTGPAQAVPASGADSEEVAAYNDEALRMFKEHAAVCLWCRMNNADAARKREAEEAERLRREAEEAERLRREAEEAERLRREAEEAERLRREAEEAERMRREAEEAERMRREAEEAERLRREAEEAERLRREAEEAERMRREAEEAERMRREAEEAERLRREAEEAERLRREAEEAERLRREAEEEERRRRLLANGKRTFLRKGEGVQAATQSAAVLETRKAEVKAREDIAAFSLSHAKKSGLVRPTAPKRAGDGVSMEEMDEATEARWDAEWSTHEEAAFSATRTSHGPTGAGGAA